MIASDGGSGGGGRPSFPAIGFDPAPGNVGMVQAVISSLKNAAAQLLPCAQRMHSALDTAGSWDGDAADGFTKAGSDLPPAFNSGAQSLDIAGSALETWASQMATNQRLADQLEKQAEQVKKDMTAQKAIADAAWDVLDSGSTGASVTPAPGDPKYAVYQRWSAAQSASDDLYGRLLDLRDRAYDLKGKHEDEANAAAGKIKSAKKGAFEPTSHPSGIQKVVDFIGSASGKVALWAGTVTAIAAPIPGVDLIDTVTGPVAAVAGGVHLATDAEQTVTGSSKAPGLGGFLLDAVDARGGATAFKEIKGLSAASKDAEDLGGTTFSNYTRSKNLAAGRKAAGDDARKLSDDELVKRGRRAARRPAAAAAAQLPFNFDSTPSGLSTAERNGLGLLIDPTGKRVLSTATSEGRTVTNHHAPVHQPPTLRTPRMPTVPRTPSCDDEQPWQLRDHMG